MKLCPYIADRFCTVECMAHTTGGKCQRLENENSMVRALRGLESTLEEINMCMPMNESTS